MISILGPNPNQVSHQNILDFLSLRKREFVDRLGWDLTHTDSAEWDDYDLPNALFVIAYENGTCIGGARLMRTDRKTPRRDAPDLTYMLGDFLSGNLCTGMSPDDMREPVEANADTWEMTRFVGNPRVTEALLAHVHDYLVEIGAHSVLTLSPRLMPIALRRLGYSVKVLSKPVEFDGKDYVAMRTLIRPGEAKPHRRPHATPPRVLVEPAYTSAEFSTAARAHSDHSNTQLETAIPR